MTKMATFTIIFKHDRLNILMTFEVECETPSQATAVAAEQFAEMVKDPFEWTLFKAF